VLLVHKLARASDVVIENFNDRRARPNSGSIHQPVEGQSEGSFMPINRLRPVRPYCTSACYDLLVQGHGAASMDLTAQPDCGRCAAVVAFWTL